jgi:hypothetical protein
LTATNSIVQFQWKPWIQTVVMDRDEFYSNSLFVCASQTCSQGGMYQPGFSSNLCLDSFRSRVVTCFEAKHCTYTYCATGTDLSERTVKQRNADVQSHTKGCGAEKRGFTPRAINMSIYDAPHSLGYCQTQHDSRKQRLRKMKLALVYF